jgi:AAA family ATP:ADP antiporter
LYPNPDYFHVSAGTLTDLVAKYPYFKWFILIGGNWSYAIFYIMAELWGSIMLSLLFWQFANQTTKTQEAKRFYAMYGLIGNLGLLLIKPVFNLNYYFNLVDDSVKLIPVFVVTIVSALVVIGLYNWINNNVLTDPTLYDPSQMGSKKKKSKLSIGESFKMIFTSKYLGLIAILVIAYGISINLVEGVWKDQIKQLFPTRNGYSDYMAGFQFWQGVAAMIFMLIGSNLLRSLSWSTAAALTPIMILITGLGFFGLIIFDASAGLTLAAFLGTSPLVMIVMLGMVQNVLSKATKYSLFDSTKEMSYIPLDDESKSKGKAAVDVVGARLGKSGGAFIQQAFFWIPGVTFTVATPYFAGIFFVIVIAWCFAIKALGREYYKKIAENNAQA